MTALVASVFIASVVGGLHCAGMCGGLMAFALGGPTKRSAVPHALYHGGRGFAYVGLGIVAGSVGSLVDHAGAMAGLSRVALLVAAIGMMAVGVLTLLPAAGRIMSCGRGLPRRISDAAARLAARVQGRAIRLPLTRRALVMGLATPLLPCGWLYAFLLTSAGTGHPVWAAVVMLAFWAGTLPAMLTLGLGLRTVMARLGPRLPTVTSLLLILAGAWTLVSRGNLDAAAIAQASVPAQETDLPACCIEEAQ
jgi:sulfite exporter TauE/SafE